MTHSPSEPEVATPQAGHGEEVSHVEPDDIGVGLLTVLFAFVAVVVLLVVVLLQAWFYNWKVNLMAERTGPINVQQAPAAVAQRQLKQIDRFGWADDKKQARAIPIDRAMALVVKEMAGDPGAPGKEKGGK